MRDRKLALIWLKDKRTEEERQELERAIRAAKPTLDLLVDIINERQKSLERPTEEQYSSPSWAHLQAHRNGRLQELNFFLSMIDLN